ncbi:hypothetical protein EKK58_03200 [Candidatus Dependentiae bacterium]|nr:MAG: hypothetical protein EKK58_03200 [Candidatus Dependentiae bacterium]
MEYNVIKNKNIQELIVHYCIAEFNKNTNKDNVFDRIHSNIDLLFLLHKSTKIYQACFPIIYNSSLQTINSNALKEDGTNKNQYVHNPLAHGIIQEDKLFTPNAFCYNAFKLAKRKNTTFVFNDMFDGPDKKNQWIFAYNTTNPGNIMEESFVIIVKLQSPNTINPIITCKRFKGSINALTLNNAENKAYVTTSITDNDNTRTTMLYDMVFSMRYPCVSRNTYVLPGISSVKKLLPLTKSLLFILSEDGVLHKVDMTNKNTSIINILDIENKKIELDTIITNPTIPYLWLLLSKASALYFVNLKNKNKKITFSKITNQFTAKNIWFDSDYILAEDTDIQIPIEKPIDKARPIQYSLYQLCMTPSKTTFSDLCTDNKNVK